MQKKLLIKILAIVSGISGVIILAYIFFPIISYDLSSDNVATYLSPVPDGATFDDTKASNWFTGGAAKEDFKASTVAFYNISIPKLKIDSATVAIGGEDLAKSLIQYPGTALPGQKGNSVIFGHSILPQFYDPKDYLAIFSTIPSLENGDEIKINYDGISYTFNVIGKVEVMPTDLQVLEQDLSDSFITLVTCAPPGHPLKPKRLIVRAKLVPFGKEAQKNAVSWH